MCARSFLCVFVCVFACVSVCALCVRACVGVSPTMQGVDVARCLAHCNYSTALPLCPLIKGARSVDWNAADRHPFRFLYFLDGFLSHVLGSCRNHGVSKCAMCRNHRSNLVMKDLL